VISSSEIEDYLKKHVTFSPTQKGSERMAHCPNRDAHSNGDRSASCSVNVEKGLLCCHGCGLKGNIEGLYKQLGWDPPPWLGNVNLKEPEILETYDYCDRDGKLLYQVVRYDPKDFRQRRPDGKGGWIWNLRGVEKVPYNLQGLQRAEYVIYVEGERDVDNLRKAGLTATTTAGGAGKIPSAFHQYFSKNQHVAIIPDNDGPGRMHALKVAQALHGHVASLKRVELPGLPDKGDVSDWLQDKDLVTAGEALSLIIDRTAEWEPGPEKGAIHSLQRFNQTDTGNAELFASRYSGRLKYDHQRKKWFLWKEQWWEADCDGEVYRLGKEVARCRYVDAIGIENLDERKDESKWAIASESRQRIESMLSLARAERQIADSGNHWDKDPFLLGVANGIVDLKTGLRREGRQQDRVTLHSDVEFKPGATCPRFEQFLKEIFTNNADLIDFIRRAVGYSISGVTKEQVLFLLYGAGANGKGVFTNTILKVFGHYSYNMPFSTFERNARTAIPNDLAALAGRRFIVSSETNDGTCLNEARVKALVHGDPVTARHLYGEFFTFTPQAKFWLAVNHRPRVFDDSLGFWRSVLLVPCERQFIGSDADKNLQEALLDEAPGILAWTVHGCLEWQKRGLDPPESVRIATEEYRRESDPLGEFLACKCTLGEEYSVKAAKFYKVYKDWAEEQGARRDEQMSGTAFGRRMGERFRKVSGRSGNVYRGVGLREDDGLFEG